MTKFKPSRNTALGLGGAALLALGLAGGAGAVSLTRPAVEMAPATPVAISSLANRDGIVTVKGRIAEVYGDRFTVADASGKTMVDAGRDRRTTLTAGAPVTVQGRFDDGQLKASFLVGQDGTIDQVGPRGPRHGPDGRGPDSKRGPGGPGHDGPPPPGGPRADGAGAPPPPPAGCAPGAAPVASPPAPTPPAA